MLNALKISRFLLILFASLLLGTKVHSATFGLTSITENQLRNAINSANSNGAGEDTIVFLNQGTITLTSALPNITSALRFQGMGARLTTIQAASTPGTAGRRVFNVTANVTLRILDMTIKNGHITSGDGAGVKVLAGDLHISDCMFIDNRGLGSSNSGGGVDALGNVYVERTSFIDNVHSRNGGALGWHPGSSKTATFTNVTFSGNDCGASQVNHGGAAFHSYSFGGTHSLSFVNCTFNENTISGTSPNNGKSIFLAAIGSAYNMSLLNTVLADGNAGNYDDYTSSGTINISRQYTISTDASISNAGAGNGNNASSLGIDTLDYHGSQMLLYSLDETSSLVDAGTDTGAPDEDQRSVPKSGNKDIGSYEYFEQACDTPNLPTTYTRYYANRLYTITAANIAGQGNVAFVNPGQNVSMTFNYSITQNGGYCPGCVVQMYVGIAGYWGYCVRSFGGYCNCSGSVSQNFTAPTQAGIYYLTTGGSLQFSCQANPQNRVSASSSAAYGAIIVGTPVNGSVISITGQNESCFNGGDSLYTNEVVGYTCTGVNLTDYEWFKDSTTIASSNTATLPITDEGVYYVRWYNYINESVYSDTFVVNSILRGFSSTTPLGLHVVQDTLTTQGDSARVYITNSQYGASYVLIDKNTGQAFTDTLNGNGDSLAFDFVPIEGVDFGFWGIRQGCSKILDTVFDFHFNTPPLNGIYTIGAGTSFDYQSFSSALYDAHARGISGHVTFRVDSGQYNEDVAIYGDSIVGLSPNRTLGFVSNAPSGSEVLVSRTASGSSDNFVLFFYNAHDVYLRGIHFKSLNSTYGRVVVFLGENENITLQNNEFEGVTASGTGFLTPVFFLDHAQGSSLHRSSFTGNRFVNGNYSVLMRDNTTDTYFNNTFHNNELIDFQYAGMFIQASDSLVLTNNYVKDKGTTSLIYGFYLGDHTNLVVKNNRVINRSTSAAYGIYTISSTGTAGAPCIVQNNAVSLIGSGSGTGRALVSWNNRHTHFLHNSIYSNNTSSTNGRGIWVTGPASYTGQRFVNNNIYLEGPGAPFEAVSTSTSGIDEINYNNYYTNGVVIGYWGGTNLGNLGVWQTFTGDDAGSVVLDPLFESDTLLKPTSLYFNNKGVVDTSIVSDIVGVTRDGSTADIGAFEYDPPFPPGEYVSELGSGNCLQFDGSNDYIDLSIPNLPQGNAARTIELWMKRDGNPSTRETIMNWGVDAANQRSGIRLEASGVISFVGNGVGNDLFGNVTVTDGRWHHVAVIHTGTYLGLFVDGVYETDAARTLNTNGTTLRIGERIATTGLPYSGQIDELRIWKTDLNEADLQEYMCQKLSRNHPAIDSLVAYIPFDEGRGNQILDIAQGYSGTFVNMDTNSVWLRSGAALGDSSVYYYDAMAAAMPPPQGPSAAPVPASQGSLNLSLKLQGGDSVTLSSFIGTSPYGAHLYYVNGAPASSTTGFGKAKMDSLNYWGTYLINGGSISSYTARSYYSDDAQLSSYKESALVALKRLDASDSIWEYYPYNLDRDTTAKFAEIKLTLENNEFWFGELDNQKPYAGPGNAISFDGTNDEIRIPSDSDFFFLGGEMTVSMWLKRDNLNANQVVLGRWTGSPYHYVFGFKYDGASDGHLRINTSAGYQNVQFSSGNVTGVWEHWSFTATAGQDVKIYKNGDLIKTQAISGNFTLTGNSHIALGSMGNTTKWFSGGMNEVSFWKRSLSQDEIRTVMALELDTNDNDLVAYYPLNQPTGSSPALDISGNNHHGTLFNMDATTAWIEGSDTLPYRISELKYNGDTIMWLPGYDADGDTLEFFDIDGNEDGIFNVDQGGHLILNRQEGFDYETDSVFYLTYRVFDEIEFDTATIEFKLFDENEAPSAGFDHALDFDAVDDYLDLTGNTAVDLTDSMTFEAWIKADNTTGRIFHNGGNNLLPGWTIFFLGSNLRVEMRNGSVAQADLNWTPYLDEWHHLAVNWNRGEGRVRVYVDGELKVQRSFFVNIGNYTGEPALGGTYTGGTLFDGKMDEVRIWDTWRPIEQITQDMFKRVDPNSAGLAAYYNFDAKDFGYDASYNRNHGRTVGFSNGSQIASIDSLEIVVSESFPIGDTIAWLSGFDVDAGDTITFSLSNTALPFNLDTETGMLTTSSALDYETDSVYYIPYVIYDLDSLSDTATIVVRVTNETEQVVAGFGQGFDFNGSGYITLPDTNRYFDNITVEAWIKPRAKNDINTIIACKAFGGAAGWAFLSNSWTTGDRRLHLETSNGSINTVDPIIRLGEWQHVAFSLQDTAVRLYHNGQLVKSGSISAVLTNSGLRRIGAMNDNSYNQVGEIDELRIWSVTRSAQEIAENYKARIEPTSSGLASYYDFNQFDTDFTLKDRTPNGYDGSLTFLTGNEWTANGSDSVQYEIVETAVAGDSAGFAFAWDPDSSNLSFTAIGGDLSFFDLDSATGLLTLKSGAQFDYESGDTIYNLTYEVLEDGDMTRDTATVQIRILDGNDAPILSFGNALSFDGTNDYATLGTGINLANKSFTISFFAKHDQPYNTGRFNAYLGQGGLGTYNGLHFLYENAQRIKHGFYNDDLIGFTTLDHKWHYLSFSYNATTNERSTYIDGELLARDTTGGDYANTGTFYLGTEAWTTNYHNGLMDEFKIYDTILTTTQIRLDMGRHLSGNESNLVTYHKFNEGTGTSLLDETGGHNGSFFNNTNPWAGRDSIIYYISETRPNNDTIASLPGYDQDEGDSISYYLLGGDTSNLFVSSDGILSFASVNYEEDSLYSLTVMVQDLEGLTDTSEIYVQVKDVNEDPYFNNVPDTLFSCAGSSSDTATLVLLDEDFQDVLANLSLSGYSSDTNRLKNDSILLIKGTDSLVYVVASPYTTTTEDTVSISVVAADHEGVTDTVSFALVIRAGMLITADTIAAPLCAGDSNAFVAISVQYGMSPFTYLWSDSSATDTLFNAAAGSYAISVTDNYGCVDTALFIVNDPTPVVASVSSSIDPSCFGYSDGIAVASGTGGALPYSFAWNYASNQTDDTASGLPDGTYLVTVTDQFACSDTASIVLTEPTQVPATFSFSSDSICDGDQATLTANAGAGLTYRWKRNSAFVGSLNAQVVQVSIGGVYRVEVTDSNNCFNLSAKDTLTVNNLPAVNLSALSNVCDQPGDSISLNNGLPIGGSYSSSTSGAVSGTSFLPGVAGAGTHDLIYSFTDAYSCSASDTVTVTVHPKPTASLSTASSFCIGDTAILLNGGSGSWTGNGVYYGSGVSNSYFDPNIAGTGSHNIFFAFADTNSCSDTASVSITVHAKPSLSHSNFSDLCVDAAPLTLSGATATPTGGSVTYSGTGVFAGDFYPDSAGVGQHFINYSYTDLNGCSDSIARSIRVNDLPIVNMGSSDFCAIPGSSFQLNLGSPSGGTYSGSGISGGSNFNPGAVGTGSYTVFYSFTDVRGCSNIDSAQITVNALPTVGFSTTYSPVCESVDSIDIDLGTPSTGGTGSYSGNGVVGSEIISNLSGSGTFIITFTFVDTNSCVDSASQSITVNPLPTVSLSSQGVYCEDSASIALSGGSPVGGTYSGTGVRGGVFTPNASLLGTNQITYSYTDANGCTDSATNTLVINAVPNVSLNLGFSQLCENDNPVNLSGGTPAGGVYSGASINGGNLDPSVNGAGTFNIVYSFTDNNGCSSSDSNTITIDTIPSISLSAFGNVCIDATPFTFTQGSSTSSGTHLYSGAGISSNVFDPVAAGPGSHLITYRFTDANTTCSAESTGNILVRALPVVSLNLPALYCVNAGPQVLSGGLPNGGSYSGSGIFGDTLRPIVSGIGVQNISYSFTDAFGCSNSDTVQVDIKARPRISNTSVGPFCEYEDPVNLHPDTIFTPGTYVYQGTGVFNDTVFDPAVARSGVHNILFSFTDTNQCRRDSVLSISVNPTPTASFSNLPAVCENANPFIIYQGVSQGTGGRGWYSGPGVLSDSTTFRADSAGSGTHTISYYYLDRNNCIDSTSQTIQVDTVPRPFFSTSIPNFCSNSNQHPLSEGRPVPSNPGESSFYSGIGILNGTFYPQYVSAGNAYTLTYRFTDANGCSGDTVAQVEVNTLPQLTPGFIATRCDNEGVDTLNFVSVQSAGIASEYYLGVGIDTTDSLSFDPALAGQGNHLITYHITDTNGCSASTQSYVTVYASSQVYLSSFASVCEGSNPITLSGGVPLGGVYSGTGISNGRFNPVVADTGTHQIKYTYTNIFGCSDSSTSSIHVNASPNLSLNLPASYCESNIPYDLIGGTPAGGTYGGLGVFNNKFYTNITSRGSFSINYAFTDTSGCSSSISRIVNVVGNPNVSITPDTLVCFGSRVRLRASGGVSYRWNTGSSADNILVRPESNERYSVSVTDANGCFETREMNVFVSPQIILSSTTNDADCGFANGSGSVQASGGVSPFGYVWSTGSIGDVQTNLRAGLYQVTVTDANRCEAITTVAISDAGGASISLDSLRNPSCPGVSDGFIDVSLSGTNNPFSIEWSNGYQTEAISGLLSGTYLLSVRDNENCLSFMSYELDEPESIDIDVLTNDANCQSANGWAKAEVLGQSPISYQWSNGQLQDSASGLPAGVYQLTVTDGNSCEDSTSVLISDIGGPQIIFDTLSNTDCGKNQGQVSITVIDSTYTYNWNIGDTTSGISGLNAGSYFVTVEDTANCKSVATANVLSNIPDLTDICMLSVDTALDRVHMYYSQDTSQAIEEYRAYREDISGANLFLAGMSKTGSVIIDTNLKTISVPWSYSLELNDSCGNSSDLPETHRIIYVQSTPLPTGPIRVVWTAYKGFEPLRYTVYRSANGGPYQVVNVVGPFQTTYFDRTYPKETSDLRYLVSADAPFDCNGISKSFSNKSLNVWDLLSTSVEDLAINNDIRIYPNPTSGMFNLEFKSWPGDLEVKIYSNSGQIVFDQSYKADHEFKTAIDLRGLAAGIYQVQILNDWGVSVTKLQLTK